MDSSKHFQKRFEHRSEDERKKYPVFLVCDGIIDIQNIGAAFRLADAAGIQKIIFAETKEPIRFHKIDKISRSTRKDISYAFCPRNEVINHLPSNTHFVALEITNQSQDYQQYQPKSPTALIIGSEQHGVSEFFLDMCEAAIHIPMNGKNSSMNVLMATAIVTYNMIGKLAPI